MANALRNKMQSIVNAIGTKKGTSGTINAENIEDEILSIEPPFNNMDITSNGEYDIKDFKKVSVLVESDESVLLKAIIEKDLTYRDIVIPYGITTIGSYTFQSFNINSIELPETLTSLQGQAFYGATINWPNFNIKSDAFEIGQSAFYNAQFTDYYIENNAFSKVTKIGDSAFRCPNLTNRTMYMPKCVFTNLEEVGSYGLAFRVFQQGIEMPKVKKLGSYAFNYEYNNFTRNILPADYELHCPELVEVGEYAFRGVRGTPSSSSQNQSTITFNLPKLKTIGKGAFSDCAIKQLIFSEEVTVLPQNMFQAMRYATVFENNTYTIPSQIVEIGMQCFYSVQSVKNIILNEGLTTIGDSAFSDCNKIQSMTIPSTVTTIGKVGLGTGSSNAKTTFTFLSSTPCSIQSNTFIKNYLDKIYVPRGSSDAYKTATNWSSYAEYIFEPNTVSLSVNTALLNNESITYSLDGGKTYSMFTQANISLEDVSSLRIKNLTDVTINIGTTSGGTEIGSITNSELIYNTTADILIYIS